MYELRVRSHFDAAHHLVGYKGKCSSVHGHRWEYEVLLNARVLDKLNMVIDFSLVKAKLKKLEDSLLDHKDLNESLSIELPTAEFLAKFIYEELHEIYGIAVESVTVWESPECSISYNKRSS